MISSLKWRQYPLWILEEKCTERKSSDGIQLSDLSLTRQCHGVIGRSYLTDPLLKFSLHRLLMDVIRVLRVPVIYSKLIHRVENKWIRTLYVIRGGINNLIIILIILQMNTNLFYRGYFKRYLNKFDFFFIHSIRIPSISFAFKSNGTFYR